MRLALYDIRSGRQEEGEAWVTRALATHGDPDTVHLRIGQLYETMNRPADAVTHYRAGLALDPDSVPLHFALGRALFAEGKDDEAVGELVRARSGPVGRRRDAHSRAVALAAAPHRRGEPARADARSVARWNGDQARASLRPGWPRVGRLDLSLTAWRRAADVTGDPQDYERLGLTWAMLGRAGRRRRAARASGPSRADLCVDSDELRRRALRGRPPKTRPAARPSTCWTLDPKCDKAPPSFSTRSTGNRERRRAHRRAEQARRRIEDDRHRHRAQQVDHRLLVEERVHEAAASSAGRIFGAMPPPT